MDTGIGPSGTENINGFTAKSGDGALQGLLHGRTVVLPLPTDESASVVLDGQLIAWHRGIGLAFFGASRRSNGAE
jgi:hypothetical protein